MLGAKLIQIPATSRGRQLTRMTTQRPRTRALPSDWLQADRPPALSVIVPTRNETDNIRPLLAGLQKALAGIDAEVLIVDDSDDATPEIARRAAAALTQPPIRVHARPPGQRPGGLGGAVLVGLSEALGPVCAVMDADLQHPPELLGTLLRASRTGADFVAASRYLDGGNAEALGGWYRRAVSTLATRLAKRVLRLELAGISDPLSGFFLVRQSCLDLPSLHPQGFKLLLELLINSPQASVAAGAVHLRCTALGLLKSGDRGGTDLLAPTQGAQKPGRSCPAEAPAPARPGSWERRCRPPGWGHDAYSATQQAEIRRPPSSAQRRTPFDT